MAVGITEYNKKKVELSATGFSSSYMDDWPARTVLYRHTPSLTVDGNMSGDIGSTTSGVPGNPDYVLRKAKQGLFPWPPGEGCRCEWCVKRSVAEAKVILEPNSQIKPKQDLSDRAEAAQEAEDTLSVEVGSSKKADEKEYTATCPDCTAVFSGRTYQAAGSAQRAHSNAHHKGAS